MEVTEIVISKYFILVFTSILVLSTIGGWLFYCINIERANKLKNMKMLTEKAVWWITGGTCIGSLFAFIMVAFNALIVIEGWYLVTNFTLMSFITLVFIIIAVITMYNLIFKMLVEDPSNTENFK